MYKNRFFQHLWTDFHVIRRNSKSYIQKIPNLLAIQQESFFHFIQVGLQTEFENNQIWFQTSILECIFYPEKLCFEVPTRNYPEFIRRKETYRTRIFIPRLIYNLRTQKVHFEWRSFRNLPVLTKQGHFIVNGSPRVCITQIIRGPGVYRGRELNSSKKIIFYIDFVPEYGRWVRLEKDSENLVWLCIRAEPRIIIERIFDRINWNAYFPRTIKKNKSIIRKKDENIVSKIKHLKKVQTEIVQFSTSISNNFEDQQIEILRLTDKFLNFQKYDIGEPGRKRINERFNQKVPISIRCLIPTDFIRAISELDKLSTKKTIRRFDDFDNLRTRRLCRVGNLLQRELRQNIFKLEQNFFQIGNDSFGASPRIMNIISSNCIDRRIHRFITANPLFHFADHLNPLADITQKRRLTGLGIGGLDASTRTNKVRNIHPSHFGRLCPIETPDGINVGIVNSPTIIRQISDDGLVQSMIFNEQNGWLQNTSERIRLKPLISLWVSQKDKNWITRLSIGLLTDILGKFQSRESKASLEIGVDNYGLTSNAHIGIVSFIATQALALSPNLIPFLQNNDANRVLMGASILRQSLPTMKSLSPRVSSGVDVFVINDIGQNLYARCPGIVVAVDRKKVIVKRELPCYSVIKYHNILKSSQIKITKKKQVGRSVPVYFLPFYKKPNPIRLCLLAYTLCSIFYTNQSTPYIQYPCVEPGIWVQTGDLLADGQASLFRRFSVGQNLLIAYMPWDGLNFEDGVVTTQTLVTKESFTTIHLEKWSSSLNYSQTHREVFVPFSPRLFPYLLQGTRFIDLVKSYKNTFSRNYINNIVLRNKIYDHRDFQIKKIRILDNQTKIHFYAGCKKLFPFQKKYFLRKSNIIIKSVKPILTNNLIIDSQYIKTLHNRIFIEKSLLKNSTEIQIKSVGRKKNRNYIFSYFEDLDVSGCVKIGTRVVSNQILTLKVRKSKTAVFTPRELLFTDVLNLKRHHFTLNDVSLYIPPNLIGRVLDIEKLNTTYYSRSSYLKKNWINIIEWEIDQTKNSQQKKFIKVNQNTTDLNCIKFTSYKNIFWIKLFKNMIIIYKKLNYILKIQYQMLKSSKQFIPRNWREYMKPWSAKRKDYTSRIVYIIPTVANENRVLRIRVTIVIHHRLQIGDKLAGRHGNKGILTRLIPLSEIPFFPNGISLDLILNPLGVPARINIGQIYETLLGLSGFYSGEQYFFRRFNESKNRFIISRTLVFEKLRISRIKNHHFWIFNPKTQGKIILIDGRTGEFIEKPISTGECYILKLVHIVDKKIHARRTGPYSLITQQPVGGRSSIGGQRIGEIEIWALERCGTSYILQEILTVKSDDIVNRGSKLLYALYQDINISTTFPEAFRILSCELKRVSIILINCTS